VPGERSSPIPSALTQLADAVPLQVAQAGHLLAYLAIVPDPRAERGRRHPLVAILAMAAAAVLTGARSVTAIAEWAADAPQPVREALGARRDAPGPLGGALRGHHPPDPGASGSRGAGRGDWRLAGRP
jgi:DDE_Tnp_1-associated